MASIVHIDTWEHSKENILPMRAGRKAATLAKVFGANANSQLEQERAQFQKRIEEASGSTDPLASWLEYYEWAKESFPTSRKEQLKVVQSATKLFRNNEAYKQDARYLRLWIIYVSSNQTLCSYDYYACSHGENPG